MKRRIRSYPKTSSYCDRLRDSWVCVVGEKGSRRTSVRLRAFSTCRLDHEPLARSRDRTGLGIASMFLFLCALIVVEVGLARADGRAETIRASYTKYEKRIAVRDGGREAGHHPTGLGSLGSRSRSRSRAGTARE